MSNQKDVAPHLPVAYTFIYFRAVEVAKRHGYAIALHGSMNRDLDMVAIPWEAGASDEWELVEAIREDLRATIQGGLTLCHHGRTAWTLLLPESHACIDLSVMSRHGESGWDK